MRVPPCLLGKPERCSDRAYFLTLSLMESAQFLSLLADRMASHPIDLRSQLDGAQQILDPYIPVCLV